jgi:putative drug exporter of the RND superfamily
MAGPLYHIGRFCSRHFKLVIAVWIAATIGFAFAGNLAGGHTSDDLSLPSMGSTKASDVLQAHLPDQAYGSNPLVLKAANGKLTDSKNAQAVDETVDNVRDTPHVTKAVNPLSDNGSAFLSKDKKTGYIPVTMNVSQSDITNAQAQAVLDAAKPAQKAGMDTSLGGYAGQKLSKPSTHTSEIIGLLAAIVILLFAFGTVTAMALPIITAVLGLVSTLSLISVLGLVTEVPTVAPTLATMIGLGVGIDYALFIVTRHKLQLRDDMEIGESIARATATAGGAVVFAGTTVVIALCSLLFAGIPLVANLGYTAAVAVVVGVLGAVTLLPALLGALGPRINSLRVKLGRTHPDDHQPHGWARWARGVAARPWLSLIASTAVLVALAIPLLHLELGQSDTGALPKSTTARQAYDAVGKAFGEGANGPLLVSTKLGKQAAPDQNNLDKINSQQKKLDQQKQQIEQQSQLQGATPDQAKAQADKQTSSQQNKLDSQRKKAENPATDPRLTDFSDTMKKAPDVKSVSPPTLDKGGHYAVFTVVPDSAPSSDATVNLVHTLRDTTVPNATKGTDMTVHVGGQTASYIDLAARISAKLPGIIAIVVGLSFLVLMLAFRSLVVPLKAAVMNLLSVGAAYGVVTAVFQDGRAAGVIGLEHAIPIVSFVPLLMFAILFGLSMDYEVFLMTQMQEEYRESRRPTKPVVQGLAGTGRVITSAALIMVCVFTSFVLNGDPVVKEFGVGLAVAIAIDATVVRCLLVPAVMTLLGKWSWWMPSWLDRLLPKISIEGEDYFAQRPAPARGGTPATLAGAEAGR